MTIEVADMIHATAEAGVDIVDILQTAVVEGMAVAVEVVALALLCACFGACC